MSIFFSVSAVNGKVDTEIILFATLTLLSYIVYIYIKGHKFQLDPFVPVIYALKTCYRNGTRFSAAWEALLGSCTCHHRIAGRLGSATRELRLTSRNHGPPGKRCSGVALVITESQAAWDALLWSCALQHRKAETSVHKFLGVCWSRCLLVSLLAAGLAACCWSRCLLLVSLFCWSRHLLISLVAGLAIGQGWVVQSCHYLRFFYLVQVCNKVQQPPRVFLWSS